MEEDSAVERQEEARAVIGGGGGAPVPTTVAGNLWRVLRRCARQGVDHSQWSIRDVYKLAAREGLRPTALVSRALRELEGHNLLMIVDDEVQWLEDPKVIESEAYTLSGVKRKRGGGTSVEGSGRSEMALGSDLMTAETDEADMLNSGAPLRVGPGDFGVDGAQGSGDFCSDGAQYGDEDLSE